MVYFVVGPPCSGKSTFVMDALNSDDFIDVKDYQDQRPHTVDGILQAEDDFVYELKWSLRCHDSEETLVAEHTMLKASRRKKYIELVREFTDEPIICFALGTKPDYEENVKKRFPEYDDKEARQWVESYAEQYEIPTKDDGFNTVYYINNKE